MRNAAPSTRAGELRTHIRMPGGEQVGWFESWGSPRVELQLEVGEGQADSRAPGRLAA